MKTTLWMATAVMLAFVSIAQAGGLVPNRTVDIRFNGFCDGMRLVINQSTGVVSGSVTGCVSGTPIGTVGGNSGKGIGVTVMSRTFLYVIDDAPQTWSLYLSNGTLFQSGTWSLGVPALAAEQEESSVATGE